MFTRETLLEALSNYHSAYEEEQRFQPAFLKLLQHPRSFHRDHLPGHITGSAFIIDNEGKHTLLTHHAKLNRWLQPGGHADGDEDIVGVATREAVEETGLKTLQLLQPHFFDIDIHTIPARKDFPLHEHYDIRFLFRASRTEKLLITEESHDLAWKPLYDLSAITGENRSMLRMAEKAMKLL
jgi:8-oxo-dGTP pyrophosphatase MutT (NUDIX family)